MTLEIFSLQYRLDICSSGTLLVVFFLAVFLFSEVASLEKGRKISYFIQMITNNWPRSLNYLKEQKQKKTQKQKINPPECILHHPVWRKPLNHAQLSFIQKGIGKWFEILALYL